MVESMTYDAEVTNEVRIVAELWKKFELKVGIPIII